MERVRLLITPSFGMEDYSDYPYHGSISMDNSGTLVLRDSEVSYSEYWGVEVNDYGAAYTTTLTIERSTIANNARHGVYAPAHADGVNQISITDSTIRDNGDDGIYASQVDSLELTGNSIDNNDGFAVAVMYSSFELNQVHSNTASGNRKNAIRLYRFTFSGVSVLNADIPYYVRGTVPSDAELQLQAGAVVKVYGYIRINGSLVAQGTAESPVYITSYKDDSVGGDTNGDGDDTSPSPGDWSYIRVEDGASATFDHTLIRYGGYYNSSGTDYGSISMDNSGTLVLRDSEVSYSEYWGVEVNDYGAAYTTTLTIERSTIANNARHGVYAPAHVDGVNQVSITDSTIRDNGDSGLYIRYATNSFIHGSNIYGNGTYGVYNGTTNSDYLINAENNWWGDDSGPDPYGSGNSIMPTPGWVSPATLARQLTTANRSPGRATKPTRSTRPRATMLTSAPIFPFRPAPSRWRSGGLTIPPRQPTAPWATAGLILTT